MVETSRVRNNLSEREALKDGLSEVRAAHEHVQGMVQLEPSSAEWCRRLHAASELVACHEQKLSCHKRELYSHYEQKYLNFRRTESARTWDKLQNSQAELRSMKEAVTRWAELRERVKLVSPPIIARIHSASGAPSSKPEDPVRVTPSPIPVPGHSIPPLPIPREDSHPRVTSMDAQRVSTPEAQNSPERAQLARPKVVPSSAELDPFPAPQGLESSPPNVTREPPPARKPLTERLKHEPPKSTSETGLPISRLQPRHSVHVKPLEQLSSTVLRREPPKGNSLTGVKPSSRVISTPASLIRVNRRAVVQPPATSRKEVSVVKGTSAIRHLPAPNVALTLRHSTSVFSVRTPLAKSSKSIPISSGCIRAPPASSSEDEAFSSSQNVSMQSASDVVSTRRVLGKGTTHPNSEARTPSRASRSLMLPLLGSSPRMAVSVRRIPSVVSSKPMVNSNAHQRRVETHTRVSPNAANPRFGEIPSAGDIECSDEHSTVIVGPAVKLALDSLSSSEAGEGLRVSATTVSIHNGEKEDTSSPSPSAAFTLPASVPISPSVPPARVGSHPQRPEGPIPSIEAISGRSNPSVVNKTSLTTVACSPSIETTRKWSHPSSTSTRGEGGCQLARAAAYIRERSSRRSPAFDEFVSRTPKAPPDKTAESANQRHFQNVVSMKEKASINICSPESIAGSPSVMRTHSQSEAILPQLHVEVEAPPLPRANELSSTELPESVPRNTSPARELPNVGVREGHSVQPVVAAEADRCSSEHLEEISEISEELVRPVLADGERSCGYAERRPASPAVSKTEPRAGPHSPVTSVALMPSALSPGLLSQANPVVELSLEFGRPVSEPPVDASSQRCPQDAVNAWCGSGVEQRSPELLVLPLPPTPKPVPPRANPCHVLSVDRWWRARCKPPNTAVAPKRRNHGVVNIYNKLSAVKHLPVTEAVFVLPISPSARLWRMSSLRRSSLELVVRALKPSVQVAYHRFLYETVNTLNKRAYSVTHLGWNATTPRRFLRSLSLRPLLHIAGRGCRM